MEKGLKTFDFTFYALIPNNFFTVLFALKSFLWILLKVVLALETCQPASIDVSTKLKTLPEPRNFNLIKDFSSFVNLNLVFLNNSITFVFSFLDNKIGL